MLPFRGEPEGVDHQGRFILQRGAQGAAGRKVDQTVVVVRGVLLPIKAGKSFQESGELASQDMKEMASLLRARRVDADR